MYQPCSPMHGGRLSHESAQLCGTNFPLITEQTSVLSKVGT